MENVNVHRYGHDGNPYAGYIEPDTQDWILFVPNDGDPTLFSERDPITGAVL